MRVSIATIGGTTVSANVGKFVAGASAWKSNMMAIHFAKCVFVRQRLGGCPPDPFHDRHRCLPRRHTCRMFLPLFVLHFDLYKALLRGKKFISSNG
jgi:hypothetical protein